MIPGQLSFLEEDETLTAHPVPLTEDSARSRLERKYAPLLREDLRLGKLVSYVGNKDLPLLRLYRYKEAFAYQFVEECIARFGLESGDYLFDPFCGMGTTLFTASRRGIASIGVDRLPIAVFIANTLPLFYALKPGQLQAAFEQLQVVSRRIPPAPIATDVAIMRVAFPQETLLKLRRWKAAILELSSPLRDVFLLLLFAVLESCSYTSKDGQFLRLVRDKATADPREALQQKVSQAERDVRLAKELKWDRLMKRPDVHLGDTRALDTIAFRDQPTALITSPPYANRYDYTRTYALELCFHFVRDFEELRALRHSVLRSHIESKVGLHEEPPHPAVREVVEFLRARGRALNNPKIPDMLTGYFIDMRQAIREWAGVLAPQARVALVVDNVRFEGELLPVDLVLSEMAEEFGFQVEEIIVARYKGNSSQQMGRYGRIPVRESVVMWTRR
jgi:hypothetical protein